MTKLNLIFSYQRQTAYLENLFYVFNTEEKDKGKMEGDNGGGVT